MRKGEMNVASGTVALTYRVCVLKVLVESMGEVDYRVHVAKKPIQVNTMDLQGM